MTKLLKNIWSQIHTIVLKVTFMETKLENMFFNLKKKKTYGFLLEKFVVIFLIKK
jgi:hypothetical protein